MKKIFFLIHFVIFFNLIIGSAMAQINTHYTVEKRTTKLEYDNQFKYPKNYVVKLDPKLLGQCFLLETVSTSSVSLGPVSQQYPELFTYLLGSSDVDYQTGKEDKLREMIMASPDNSIDPTMLFQWSLKLNHGQLFETILTIHELLRNEARFYRDWVHYDSSKDKMRSFFNKLIDIRGDLEERGNNYHGDHRGSWYRIWGSMLHYLKMVAPTQNYQGTSCSVLGTTSSLNLASIRGSLTAHLAEIVKPIMYGTEGDPRKAEVNTWGYDTMKAMIQSAKSLPKDPKQIAFLKAQCKARSYLVDQESIIQTEYKKTLQDSRHPSHFEP